ncbi:hypothetical protein [Clostridium sp. ATCC 25772]|uniref:hypothetical protein n=1 Tax=Clostridium sp. ATCC 25772 TaxID=1676991 RepID=UPI000785F532|nr:hypothetical protein [Clostridium sp. ATCC 25772]
MRVEGLISRTNTMFSQIKKDEENVKLNLNKNNKFKKTDIISNFQEAKENLIKQKENLQKQDLTPEEKIEKNKELDAKIKLVEDQMQQALMIEKEKELEKTKEKLENKEKENKSGDEEKDGVIVSESLKNLIKAKNSMDNIHSLNTTKGNLKVELGYLESVKYPNNFVSKQKLKLERSIHNIESRANSELSKANRAIKKESNMKKENEIKKEDKKDIIED